MKNYIPNFIQAEWLAKTWLRWLIALILFYFIFATGLESSNSLVDLAMQSLSSEASNWLGFLVLSGLFVILAKITTILGLSLAVVMAYGVIQYKRNWFLWMSIICFMVGGYFGFLKPIIRFISFIINSQVSYSGISDFAHLLSLIIPLLLGGILTFVIPLFFIGSLLFQARTQRQQVDDSLVAEK